MLVVNSLRLLWFRAVFYLELRAWTIYSLAVTDGLGGCGSSVGGRKSAFVHTDVHNRMKYATNSGNAGRKSTVVHTGVHKRLFFAIRPPIASHSSGLQSASTKSACLLLLIMITIISHFILQIIRLSRMSSIILTIYRLYCFLSNDILSCVSCC